MHQREDRRGRANAQRQRQDRGDGERRSHSQASQRMARILHQRFHKRESSLVPIAFLDGFHRCRTSAAPAAALRRATGRREDSRQFDSAQMYLRFPPASALRPACDVAQRSQPPEESPQRSHFRSSAFTAKNRPMIAAVCSQLRVSACNCLRPCRVSAGRSAPCGCSRRRPIRRRSTLPAPASAAPDTASPG